MLKSRHDSFPLTTLLIHVDQLPLPLPPPLWSRSILIFPEFYYYIHLSLFLLLALTLELSRSLAKLLAVSFMKLFTIISEIIQFIRNTPIWCNAHTDCAENVLRWYGKWRRALGKITCMSDKIVSFHFWRIENRKKNRKKNKRVKSNVVWWWPWSLGIATTMPKQKTTNNNGNSGIDRDYRSREISCNTLDLSPNSLSPRISFAFAYLALDDALAALMLLHRLCECMI